MPKWLNIVLQVIALAGQGFNLFGHMAPPTMQPIIATGIGAAQAAIAVIAHDYNPDGTPATVPFVKP